MLAIVGLAGCSRQPPPNVILISIDTLRADHLGVAGYSRDTSPRLDELGSRSTIFSQAFTPAPRTFTSHAMMLTGIHPHRMGVTRGGHSRSIPREVPWLPEILQQVGYQTVGFVDSAPSGWLSGKRRFDRGFDEYFLAPHAKDLWYAWDMAATADRASAWLDNRDPDRPFFMFMHTKSVHAVRSDLPRPDARIFPYDKPEPYRSRFLLEDSADFTWSDPEIGAGSLYLAGLNQAYYEGTKDPSDFPQEYLEILEALYDAGIYYTDEHLGRFLDHLEATDLLDNTIVVVTSDHGEAFLEHGFFKHSATVYKEMLHVPLIVHRPGSRGNPVRSEPVSIGDIPPTILDLLGLPVPPEIGGWPLFNDAFASYQERALFAITQDGLTPARGLSIRRGDWKLVYDSVRAGEGFQVSLFNVVKDPNELQPIAGETERAAALLQELLAWREGEEIAVGEEIEVDDETLEHLRAVGYIN